MLVEVISTVDEVKQETLFKKTIIIVDVLRTSTTIITALASGAKWIIPVETIGQAKTLRNTNSEILLAGDRYSKKIPEFDLGNSPTEFLNRNVENRSIALSTSDGTRAIQKVGKGGNILIGGFLNGESCAQKSIQFKRDILILCVGNRNEFALEDGLAAGYLIDELAKASNQSIETNDLAKSMYGMYKFYEYNLLNIIKQSDTAKRLIQLGYTDDVHFSSSKNKYPICPLYDPLLNIIQPSSD